MSTSQTAWPRCEEPTSYTSTRVAQASLPHLPAWSPVEKKTDFCQVEFQHINWLRGKGGEGECKEISVSLGTLSWELNPMTNAFD